METFDRRFDQEREDPLKNFLRGMETCPYPNASGRLFGLKNFLRGMETCWAWHLLADDDPPSKTSLEGWKLMEGELTLRLSRTSKTSLEGWKHVYQLGIPAVLEASKTSLEGWKPPVSTAWRSPGYSLKNFLRGMETAIRTDMSGLW